MSGRRIVLGLAVALLALPALAAASANPTATGIRIGDHPGFVRAVVDFTGGAVKGNDVQFFGITKRDAAVLVFHANAKLPPASRSGYGIAARLQPGSSHVTVKLSFAPRKFKYLAYAVVTGNRLAIDLWKSAPPAKPTSTCTSLALRAWRVNSGSIAVTGTQHNIFENQFQLVVRGANGAVLGRRSGTFGPGLWHSHVHYTASHRQTGTLEAVAFSAKDGALECLAQTRVALPAS